MYRRICDYVATKPWSHRPWYASDLVFNRVNLNLIYDLSIPEFPSLQRVLLDSELPSLVVKMSSCDGESFVRSTAIKCLQKMIQVDEIWKNVLQSENLSVNKKLLSFISEKVKFKSSEIAWFLNLNFEW